MKEAKADPAESPIKKRKTTASSASSNPVKSEDIYEVRMPSRILK